MKYQNRYEAGAKLADELLAYANREDVILLALPRGGVPVAYEIATRLHLPFDIFIVRKLGVPGQSEYAMGAIAMGGVKVLNEDVIEALNVEPYELDSVIAREQQELERREKAYRGSQPFPAVKDKTIILVDDGMATGASMRVAISALREMHPASIVVAVPVADQAVCEEINKMADEVVCPLIPAQLTAVGLWYKDFSQTEDNEVFELLKRRGEESSSSY